jgi:hypothetical protein
MKMYFIDCMMAETELIALTNDNANTNVVLGMLHNFFNSQAYSAIRCPENKHGWLVNKETGKVSILIVKEN